MGERLLCQLGERLLCKQEVIGSNPFTSTIRGTIRRHHPASDPAFGEDLERSRSAATRPGARCLKGEERVCHVTEADRLGAAKAVRPFGEAELRLSGSAGRARARPIRRSVFM